MKDMSIMRIRFEILKENMIIKKAEKQTEKKKVCMIGYVVYPFDNRVRREAETLVDSGGFEVTVFCLKESDVARSYSMEKVIVKELNVGKYAGDHRFRYLITYLMFLIKAFLACTGHFLRTRIDIVHIHNMPNILVLAAIVPKIFGRTIVLDMHDSVPDMFVTKFSEKKSILLRMLCLEEKLSAWLADKIICVNHIQKEITVRRGVPSKKIYISMNVPDHKKFGRIKTRDFRREEDGRFNLVYHGTFTKRLGIDLAIEAVRKLKKQIPEIKLHLWGGGDYLDTLRSQSAKSGCKDFVSFHRWVSVEELVKVLSKMDVGVIPNRKSVATELMLPVKLMEYVMLAIPVVAPRLEAITYYFTDDMVSFFEPDNIDAMADAILKIYQDTSHGELQAERAKEFIKQYGWEKQSLEFIGFYKGLSKRRNNRLR
jgi:glycosyltransferase involved in cell wall biosynthesis